MGSSRREIELEEQLKEAGNMLLNPPSSVDEVINLLDKVENLLANVEQAPSRSMLDAILPTMKALIANALLRHSDMDVRLSVTSCINEITRITAPESPYDDDHMKEIFQLTVAAFENLSHASGRYYMKALSILDIVAKVRSCLLMLDLECDKLVIEMFRHFLKVISSNHPHAVFSSMETIMTLVVDESEEVSWDVLRILLASVRKENQDVSPVSWKLGEKVFTNCAAKLKTNLKEAVQSRGIALDEYAEIVACICGRGDEKTQHGHLNGSKNLLETKEPDPLCLGEVFHDVDGLSQSVTSNGTAPSGNDDSVVKEKISNILERCSQVEHSQIVDARCSAGPDTLDSMRNMKSEIEQESAPKKRGRKPNSLMNPEEGYDYSWICSGRKTAKVPGRRKSHVKEVDCLPSVNQDSKKALSASPKSGDLRNHRGDGSKKQGNIMNQDADMNSLSISLSTRVEEEASGAAVFSLRREPEDGSDSEIKSYKHSKSNEEISRPPGYGVSGKESEIPSDLKEKPWQLSVSKKRGRSLSDDRSSVQKDIKRGSLVVAISAQNVSEASSAKKKKISKATIRTPNREGNFSEDTPKSEVKQKHSVGKEERMIFKVGATISEGNLSLKTPKTGDKRKHTAGKEMAYETPHHGEQLVGYRIKVWWPMDKTFYKYEACWLIMGAKLSGQIHGAVTKNGFGSNACSEVALLVMLSRCGKMVDTEKTDLIFDLSGDFDNILINLIAQEFKKIKKDMKGRQRTHWRLRFVGVRQDVEPVDKCLRDVFRYLMFFLEIKAIIDAFHLEDKVISKGGSNLRHLVIAVRAELEKH